MQSPFGFPMAAGGRYEVSVTAASTANVADLTACSTTMDGITLVEGNYVLLKDQTDSEENGVYKVGVVSGSTAPLTRVDQADNAMEVGASLHVYVAQGTSNEDHEYKLTTDGDITAGTTSLAFTATVDSIESLETRLSADESTGELSSASTYTSLTGRVSVNEDSVTSLDTRISSTDSTETAKTTSLDTRVSNEESNRTSAVTSVDTAFSTADSTEASTRASADTSIDTAFSTADASLDTVYSTDVASIDTRISSIVASIDA